MAGGALFGAGVGAAQALVLRRIVPAGGLVVWILVNALASVATNALQQLLFTQRPIAGCLAALLQLWGLVSGTIHGLVTGIVLTVLLRRAAREPAPPPLTPPAAG